MNDNELNRKIDERIRAYMKGTGFTDRKLADTPTDDLMVTPRSYVNMNGATASRPTSSVVGQFYFDTSLAAGNGQPIWWNGTSFVDADGNTA